MGKIQDAAENGNREELAHYLACYPLDLIYAIDQQPWAISLAARKGENEKKQDLPHVAFV